MPQSGMTERGVFMQEVIIGYQGEMSLKGLNRNQFESATIKILRYRLKDAGQFRVWCAQSTFYIEPEDDAADLDLAFERVSKVFGLAAVSRSAARASFCPTQKDTASTTADASATTHPAMPMPLRGQDCSACRAALCCCV